LSPILSDAHAIDLKLVAHERGASR